MILYGQIHSFQFLKAHIVTKYVNVTQFNFPNFPETSYLVQWHVPIFPSPILKSEVTVTYLNAICVRYDFLSTFFGRTITSSWRILMKPVCLKCTSKAYQDGTISGFMRFKQRYRSRVQSCVWVHMSLDERKHSTRSRVWRCVSSHVSNCSRQVQENTSLCEFLGSIPKYTCKRDTSVCEWVPMYETSMHLYEGMNVWELRCMKLKQKQQKE